ARQRGGNGNGTPYSAPPRRSPPVIEPTGRLLATHEIDVDDLDDVRGTAALPGGDELDAFGQPIDPPDSWDAALARSRAEEADRSARRADPVNRAAAVVADRKPPGTDLVPTRSAPPVRQPKRSPLEKARRPRRKDRDPAVELAITEIAGHLTFT